MSSFQEENLYDFLEPKPTPTPKPDLIQNPFLNEYHHSAKYYILQEIVESGGNAEVDVVGNVVDKYLNKKLDDDDGELISGLIKKKKWLVKCLKKDGYNASLCCTYWPTSLNCPGGEYEYIDIICKTKRGGGPYKVIVDVDFKSQFEVARPTQGYKKLCHILPQIFVGDEQKLNNIISILCGEANNSFRARGLHVPPWRTPCYMHSKWFSTSQKLPAAIAQERRPEVDDHLLVSSKLNYRRRYLGVGQYCGLSSEFGSAMITKC